MDHDESAMDSPTTSNAEAGEPAPPPSPQDTGDPSLPQALPKEYDYSKFHLSSDSDDNNMLGGDQTDAIQTLRRTTNQAPLISLIYFQAPPSDFNLLE